MSKRPGRRENLERFAGKFGSSLLKFSFPVQPCATKVSRPGSLTIFLSILRCYNDVKVHILMK